MESTDTGGFQEEAQIDISHECSCFPTPTSPRDITASFWNTLSHTTSQQTHNLWSHTLKYLRQTVQMNRKPAAQLPLTHSGTIFQRFRERMAHGRKKKKINKCSVFYCHWPSVRSRMSWSLSTSNCFMDLFIPHTFTSRRHEDACAHKCTPLQAKRTSAHSCLFSLWPLHLSTDHPSIHNLLIRINGEREVVTRLQDVA